MQYIWDSFNIKTFPANTFVFVDGVYRPELSDYESRLFDINITENTGVITILKAGVLPVHIIYAGTVSNDQSLKINIVGDNVSVFMTGRFTVDLPVKWTKIVKNAGKNSTCESTVLVKNKASFAADIRGEHSAPDTTLVDRMRVVAHSDTTTDLSGAAVIKNGVTGCVSDVSLDALCAPDIKGIIFRPMQYIGAKPQSATHSAAVWRGSQHQNDYLRGAGLSGAEIDAALREAFENALNG